ncbi:hypothetical protein LCGC14_0736140 [marine sediment metagenome]|uniref:Uncharacterized protein n=1 Tax=marine sediment metagenome TaxID=412755 RepID=A0A0F9QT12_9ZZZZ
MQVDIGELRREEERAKRLAEDALIALAGAGITTPLEGFYLAPHTLRRAIHDLRDERDQAQAENERLKAALRLLIPFVEDAWQGSRGCLMPNCVLEAGHTKECPIGIGRAALDWTLQVEVEGTQEEVMQAIRQGREKRVEATGRKVVEAEKRIQHPISSWILDLEAALAEEDADDDPD